MPPTRLDPIRASEGKEKGEDEHHEHEQGELKRNPHPNEVDEPVPARVEDEHVHWAVEAASATAIKKGWGFSSSAVAT